MTADTKNYFMNRNLFLIQILFSFMLFHSCDFNRNENKNKMEQPKEVKGIEIDSVYSLLSNGSDIQSIEWQGKFEYTHSDQVTNKYIAQFISDSIKESVTYESNGETKQDIIEFNKNKILLKSKFDPLSMKIYWIDRKVGKNIVFIGQAQSASGTGVQMTYFVLLEFDRNKKNVVNSYEFESRFGTIKSITEKDSSNLNYFKIVRGKDDDLYDLSVRSVKNNEQVIGGEVVLRYLLNDKFHVLENHLIK